ncbi:putative hydrolase [Rubripirellula reticaptiva]|uniref:Putative hydrolase n=2 Tax=Rubripirellula reticaptiva TaxID=2528013 RepID=A0A5C6FD82_9BACT|nr:putative hydrolase [Rubripirellula reticaptiva]
MLHRNPDSFQPPPFVPHPIFRGGHLQTITPVGGRSQESLLKSLAPTAIPVKVSDGDSIVLHEDLPCVSDAIVSDNRNLADPEMAGASVLLVHGLTGCHAADYMVRLADRFTRRGLRVFRMDMRGFGAATDLTRNLSHAGRSDDCLAALRAIAERCPSGPIFAIGISLGAGQLLRAMGRVGAGLDATPTWIDRFSGLAAVCPPLDLTRCSDNMQRLRLRPYNRYFIRSLLSRIPPGVRDRHDFAACVAGSRPRTLRELDDRFTAPLSGFASAADYYDASSSCHVVGSISVPTLVLTAVDDPIVPVDCFRGDQPWSDSTRLMVLPTGGHVGFIDRRRRSWMDDVLEKWVMG